jgi:hypothetical protein
MTSEREATSEEKTDTHFPGTITTQALTPRKLLLPPFSPHCVFLAALRFINSFICNTNSLGKSAPVTRRRPAGRMKNCVNFRQVSDNACASAVINQSRGARCERDEISRGATDRRGGSHVPGERRPPAHSNVCAERNLMNFPAARITGKTHFHSPYPITFSGAYMCVRGVCSSRSMLYEQN